MQLALHDAHERGIHRGFSIHEVAMRAEGDVDDHVRLSPHPLGPHCCGVVLWSLTLHGGQGIYVRYSRNASDNPIGLGSSNRQLAIGDTVVISDEIAIAGDVAGAMYSEETGLALKPLVRPKKRPYVCVRVSCRGGVFVVNGCASLGVSTDCGSRCCRGHRRCCRGCLGSVWYTITVEPQPLTAVFEYFGTQ